MVPARTLNSVWCRITRWQKTASISARLGVLKKSSGWCVAIFNSELPVHHVASFVIVSTILTTHSSSSSAVGDSMTIAVLVLCRQWLRIIANLTCHCQLLSGVSRGISAECMSTFIGMSAVSVICYSLRSMSCSLWARRHLHCRYAQQKHTQQKLPSSIAQTNYIWSAYTIPTTEVVSHRRPLAFRKS